MAKENTVKAIAKVMIAAAWADGEITHDEITSLKDLLFRLPDMTASDWAELDIYIETPVGEAERLRLVESLRSQISKPEEKELALSALDEVITADGSVTDGERELVEQFKPMLEEANVGLFKPLSRLMRGSMDRHSQALANAPNREVYLDDFMNNRVFYLVSRRLEMSGDEISVPEGTLRKLSLAGGLMARVAYVDREVNEAEFNTMADILEEKWGVTRVEAALIAEAAVTDVESRTDIYIVARDFFDKTNQEERVKFLDVLFAVADGDGFVSYEETEEIRIVAKMLKMTHREFIDAKLKIPSDRRSS
jgi:uncharacterized tellurite resistance protein B-like protein